MRDHLLDAQPQEALGPSHRTFVVPPEGTLGYVTCALAANSTKRRKKMGSSVAYKTIGTFLSQDKRHKDACGWATEMRNSGCAAVRHRPTLCFTHRTCKFDLFSEFIILGMVMGPPPGGIAPTGFVSRGSTVPPPPRCPTSNKCPYNTVRTPSVRWTSRSLDTGGGCSMCEALIKQPLLDSCGAMCRMVVPRVGSCSAGPAQPQRPVKRWQAAHPPAGADSGTCTGHGGRGGQCEVRVLYRGVTYFVHSCFHSGSVLLPGPNSPAFGRANVLNTNEQCRRGL